jgi:aldehyde:ferredoxin oxidoreductase
MTIIRVDTRTLQVNLEADPVPYERLGGRALIAKLLLEEVSPRCDPLGPENKLIIAPGLLGGSGVTAAGRLSIGGKSPLTSGVKEANAGGTAGDTLGALGVKAIVVENQTLSDHWYILLVHVDLSADLIPFDELKGQGTYATSEFLQDKFGKDTTVISIGQAGEQMLRGAGIAVTGSADQRSNHAARGGLGALMGSKHLKAVVIEKPTAKRPLHDPELLHEARRRFASELINSPKLGRKGSQHLYGTASIVGAVNEMGSLPTRGFSSGKFEAAETLRGEFMRKTILERGGKIGTSCMPGCVIACRNVYVDQDGEPIVGTLQYETIALIGSNLGFGNLDDVAHLNYLCNDYGLDTIEMGAALGVAVEAGLAEFGDLKSIAALLEQVPLGTETGKMIGNGTVATGEKLGIKRVPAALGQGMPGYDPRSLKGNGVTYATSPQGADHTAGNAFGARNEVDPLGISGQKELSFKLQVIAAMLDSTGLCLFARPPIIANPQWMVDIINGIYGWGWTVEDYHQFNQEVLRMELEFNSRAGITTADYRIPSWMQEEPLPPHQVVFDVPDSDLDDVFKPLFMS